MVSWTHAAIEFTGTEADFVFADYLRRRIPSDLPARYFVECFEESDYEGELTVWLEMGCGPDWELAYLLSLLCPEASVHISWLAGDSSGAIRLFNGTVEYFRRDSGHCTERWSQDSRKTEVYLRKYANPDEEPWGDHELELVYTEHEEVTRFEFEQRIWAALFQIPELRPEGLRVADKESLTIGAADRHNDSPSVSDSGVTS